MAEMIQIPFVELLKEAIIPEAFPFSFANHAQIMIQGETLFLDFYILYPSPGVDAKPTLRLVHRIVLPLEQAKGFTSAIANMVASYELTTEKKLPNLRGDNPTDLMKIWGENG